MGDLVDPFGNDLLEPTFLDGGAIKVPQLGNRIYDQDYYTSNQASLYIGDVLVDEIVSLQFQVTQNKRPIYGYASQLFDTISKGTVIVEGQFGINFKESGYLWLILHRYHKMKVGTDEILDKYANLPGTTAQDAKQAYINQTAGKQALGGKNNPFVRFTNKDKDTDLISRASIERLIQGRTTVDERFQFYQNLAGYATVNNPNALDRAFENIVEVFEDAVWQGEVQDLDFKARRVDDNFFDLLELDMFLVFGDYTKPGANHTVKRLRNVHFTGSSLPVTLDEGSVMEYYSFFCRNVL